MIQADRQHSSKTPAQKLTIGETLRVLTDVVIPTFAKGVIIRRPKVVSLAERLNLDQRAVQYMQRLRNKYKTGPVLLRIPIRSQALILSPDDVYRVLDSTPEPFSTASDEKRAALSHFQPAGALISHGPERADRRKFNEAVLDADCPMHRLADRFTAVVNEEAEDLLATAQHRGELVWEDFGTTWFRVVRRVVFGDGARDDHELTRLIDQLRSDANWAFFRPKRTELRDQFYNRMNEHLARAEPGSLASIMASMQTTAMAEPSQQVPQWLFAFDPAGMTTFRALALLASHPEHAEHARKEIRETQGVTRPDLLYLRASVLEALRLWPTTPAVLRQSTEETSWATGVMPVDTSILIFAPFFHRDDQRLSYAHQFTPGLWLQKRTNANWPLVPFSSGPAVCPGRFLVLQLTSAMLGRLINTNQVQLKPADRLDPRRPLPGTLNNYSLRFNLSPLAD